MGRFICCIALILLLAVGHANAQDVAAVGGKSPFVLRLVEPRTLLPSERSPLQFEVENVSDKAVNFVVPLDGSEAQLRYPHVTVSILDSAGQPVATEPALWCPVVNPLRASDIQTFAPGQKQRYGVFWPALQKPGTYSVSLTYSLASPDFQLWLGSMKADEAPAELATLLGNVPRVILKSEPLQVQVRDFDKHTVAEAIANHFKGRSEAFVRRDLQRGQWDVTDIRRLGAYFSCVVKFAPGYTPPPLPSYANSVFRFAEGRFLFQPDHGWRNDPEKVAMAERNIVSSRYKVHPPGRAARAARHDFSDEKNILSLGFPLRSPEELRDREIAERHPLYRPLRERLGEPYYPDYLWLKGVLVQFRAPVPNEGYTLPAVGFHFGLEGETFKLISLVGELRYLLLAESPLSTPLRGLIGVAGLSEEEVKTARVRAEIQADGQLTFWLRVNRKERGAFAGALDSDKVNALNASPPHQGHRF